MQDDKLVDRSRFQFYGGCWHLAQTADRHDVVNPSTGDAFATVEYASKSDVSAAVSAAVLAWPQWKLSPAKTRAHYLAAFAQGLEARKDSLCQLQMLNNGKPLHEALIDVEDAIAAFEYYAELAETLDESQGTVVDLADDAYAGCTYFEAIGPVGLIVPWNFPLVTSAWKIAPRAGRRLLGHDESL